MKAKLSKVAMFVLLPSTSPGIRSRPVLRNRIRLQERPPFLPHVVRVALFFTFLVWAGSATAAWRIDWYSLDGGGGPTPGDSGLRLVSGTIGQMDAIRLTGSHFTLEGGFGVVAGPSLPLPPPKLSIRQADGTVVLSWPSSPDYDLEETTTLKVNGSWAISSGPRRDDGHVTTMTLPAVAAQKFFRLKKL